MFYMFKTILLIFLISFIISPQSEIKGKINLSDTLNLSNIFNSDKNFLMFYDDLKLHQDFSGLNSGFFKYDDPNTIWLRTSMVITNVEWHSLEYENHLLSPLLRKYFEDSKFNPIRLVLGMAQAGAVGYLAYKHLKKYGFK